MNTGIALQMYTLRNETAQDFLGTLREVVAIGYEAVELAGMGSHTAEQIRAELDALGLVCSGAHVPIERLRTDLDAVIAEIQTLGGTYVICPYLTPEQRGDADAYRALAAEFNPIGARCAAAGMVFCYHHHDFELEAMDGSTGLHILRDNTEPQHMAFEIDIFWAKAAGFDPAGLIGEFAGRVALVHLKDMTGGDAPTFAEVGHGTLDIPGAIAAAEAAGARQLVVEQDACQRSPLESVRMSREYLRSIGR
jgi:sugar phosphate isomerase/epimerase